MMLNILPQVAAVLLFLCALGGLIVAFLLDTAIMPWAVAILVSYGILRIEQLHKKLDSLFEVND